MSGTGERDDAPDFEEVVDGEEHGAVSADTDDGDRDEVGEEPGEGTESDSEDDAAGADEGQGGSQDQVAVKPRSAATIAVQTAKRAAKEDREARERAEARLAEMERAQHGQRTAEEQRLEQERVALMSPDERVSHEVGKVRQETRNELGALKFQMWDSADRTAFDGLCSRNPAFETVRDDVERQADQMRRAGQSVPERKVLATYFIGQRAIERAANGGKTKQAKKGQENIKRQTVKPGSGRSDQQADGGRRGGNEAAARKARLEDQQI